MQTSARYDGFAEWYDEQLASFTLAAGDAVERLVGPGSGRCLDLCCGTGLHVPQLLALGWQVTGVDISEDQLRIARRRVGARAELVRADAAALPFPDARFDVVVSMFSHTDVDDFAALVREGARVLRPGGSFVYAGVHPCFVGPHARFAAEDEPPTLHPGYRDSRRYTESPGSSPEGLRAKVGAVHLPLGAFIGAFLAAPLRLELFEEHGGREYPPRVVLRARQDENVSR